MKSPTLSFNPGRPAGLLTALFLSWSVAAPVQAASPGRTQSHVRFSGMYKVVSSNDPVFPEKAGQEWFLDFGEGASSVRRSGTVAVTMRQNPNLKIRILVWQVFPETGTLVIGNQTAEGERRAVVLADWGIRGSGQGGLRLQRESYHVVLHPAGPDD